MTTGIILQQDFVDDMLMVLPAATRTPSAIACCLCYEEYGNIVLTNEADTKSWRDLPYHDTFAPDLVEPIATPCDYYFCILCIGKWLLKKQTCPMCRTPVNPPDRAYGADDCDEVSSARPEGLMHTYRISESRAAEIYDIIRLNTCRLLTTDALMPVIWSPENLVFNLPELMVTIA
ncbi:hypothetical protein BU25DRAFT_470995 [Macroventuria anomochaeta]|uniref:Uncharacterized protein n=1 Tax=Macroventuria anomochaeta TaxID=301207 RepID=A0ACB6SF79_9PLEO|nr:uncharacterized protein BU25DRAFT_470995 [Macroventuria anomochaeta]KAF2632930.1 hypothetical protein BU25DRAFT_470995 [Macroventuria anomochaeta]